MGYTLDGIDGKQARRTASSTPLGERGGGRGGGGGREGGGEGGRGRGGGGGGGEGSYYYELKNLTLGFPIHNKHDGGKCVTFAYL